MNYRNLQILYKYLIIFCAIILFSCCKKAKLEKLNSAIQATWIQVEPICSMASGLPCDTVVFNDSQTVLINSYKVGSYDVNSLDTITIIIGTEIIPLNFELRNENSILEIMKYEEKLLGSSTPLSNSTIFEKK